MNKKTLYLILLGVVLVLVLAPQVVVLALDPIDPAGEMGSTGNTGSASSDPGKWASKAEKAVTEIGGSIVIIGWVIAGILWLTSAGNPAKIGVAKSAIVACVIGTLLIIIAAGAQAFITSTFGIGG